MSTASKVITGLLATLVIGAVIWLEEKDRWFPPQDKIVATISPGDAGCTDPSMPHLVTFHNQSGRQVGSMSYSVSFRQVRHSTVLRSQQFSTDEILAADGHLEQCVSRPTAYPTLESLGGSAGPLPPIELPQYQDDELVYSVKVEGAEFTK